MTKFTLPWILGVATASISLTVFAACSANAPASNQAAVQAATGQSRPDLSDCVLISTGSPSKYVCNDKTYTSYELTKLRSSYGAHQ